MGISNQALSVLERVQSPKMDDLLGEYMSTGYRDYFQNTHNTGVQNIDGLEEFCKLIYTDWYYKMISPASKNQTITKILLKNAFFHPAEVERRGGLLFYKFILNGYDEYFKKTNTYFAKLQSNQGLICDVDSLGDDFLHVFGYKISDKKLESVDARLYLNLKAQNIPLFAIEAYTKCKDKNLSFYFKFRLQDNRNDSFLFYTSYDDLASYIEIIEEIRREKPELFDGAEKVSKNMGVLYGYIGYGDEPVVQNVDGERFSYNSLRKKCINGLINDLSAVLDKKFNKTANNKIFANYMTFDECCDFVLQKYMPKLLVTNLTNVSREDVEKAIKQKFREKLKSAILTDVPMNDIVLNFGFNNRAEMKVSSVDWIKELYQLSNKKYDKNNKPLTRTAFRGYLTRFTAFSGTKLNKDELHLMQVVRENLILGMNEDLENPKISNTSKQNIQKYLSILEVPFAELDETAKGVVLLAAANFTKRKSILINSEYGAFSYNNHLVDVCRQVVGEEKVDNLINSACKHYHISKNVCFNAETDLQIEQARIPRTK